MKMLRPETSLVGPTPSYTIDSHVLCFHFPKIGGIFNIFFYSSVA